LIGDLGICGGFASGAPARDFGTPPTDLCDPWRSPGAWTRRTCRLFGGLQAGPRLGHFNPTPCDCYSRLQLILHTRAASRACSPAACCGHPSAGISFRATDPGGLYPSYPLSWRALSTDLQPRGFIGVLQRKGLGVGRQRALVGVSCQGSAKISWRAKHGASPHRGQCGRRRGDGSAHPSTHLALGMGSRGRYTRQRPPRTRPKIRRSVRSVSQSFSPSEIPRELMGTVQRPRVVQRPYRTWSYARYGLTRSSNRQPHTPASYSSTLRKSPM
jgi:hypothetical protein